MKPRSRVITLIILIAVITLAVSKTLVHILTEAWWFDAALRGSSLLDEIDMANSSLGRGILSLRPISLAQLPNCQASNRRACGQASHGALV